MDQQIWGFIFGGLAGGLVAFFGKGAEKWFIDFRLNEAVEARRKIRQYSKPLWLDCHELEFRLLHILKKSNSARSYNDMVSLTHIPREGNRPLEWYTKEGYYMSSTAYLIASVACWIRIFEREIVFLNFRKNSLTARFYSMIEKLKQEFSNEDSPLYYYYFNGIGERLIAESGERPLGIAEFTHRLCRNNEFAEYYDQLFQYIRFLAVNQTKDMIIRIANNLKEIQKFLESNGAVPIRQDTPDYEPSPEIC